MVTLLGVVLGVAAVAVAVVALAPWLQSSYGITLTLSAPIGRAMGPAGRRAGRGLFGQPGAGLARLPAVAGRRAVTAQLSRGFSPDVAPRCP